MGERPESVGKSWSTGRLSTTCPHVPQGSGRSAGLVHKSTGQALAGAMADDLWNRVDGEWRRGTVARQRDRQARRAHTRRSLRRQHAACGKARPTCPTSTRRAPWRPTKAPPEQAGYLSSNGPPAAQERIHVTPPPYVARAMLAASGRPIHTPLARANTPRALSISTTPIKSHHCLPVNWVNSASTTNGGVRFGEQRRVNSRERQGP